VSIDTNTMQWAI